MAETSRRKREACQFALRGREKQRSRLGNTSTEHHHVGREIRQGCPQCLPEMPAKVGERLKCSHVLGSRCRKADHFAVHSGASQVFALDRPRGKKVLHNSAGKRQIPYFAARWDTEPMGEQMAGQGKAGADTGTERDADGTKRPIGPLRR